MNGIQERKMSDVAQNAKAFIGTERKNQQNELDIEMWRDVQGWEGIYKVSSHGRLMSLKVKPFGLVLKNTNKKGGYFSVVLQSDGKENQYIRMHRLVAESFLEKISGKTFINHKDFNKQNNHINNLEWVSPHENSVHAVAGKPEIISGMVNYNKFIKPKRIIQLSMNGDVLATFPNTKEASTISGVCQRNIHQVAAKTEYKPGLTRSQAGGYMWRFDDRI